MVVDTYFSTQCSVNLGLVVPSFRCLSICSVQETSSKLIVVAVLKICWPVSRLLEG